MSCLRLSVFISFLLIIVGGFIIINVNGSKQLYQNCLVYNCSYLKIDDHNYLILNNNLPLCTANLYYPKNNTKCYTDGFGACPKYDYCYNKANQDMTIFLDIMLFLLFVVSIAVYWFFVIRKEEKEPEYLRIVN